jgi:hypothetical protein
LRVIELEADAPAFQNVATITADDNNNLVPIGTSLFEVNCAALIVIHIIRFQSVKACEIGNRALSSVVTRTSRLRSGATAMQA